MYEIRAEPLHWPRPECHHLPPAQGPPPPVPAVPEEDMAGLS